MKAPADRRATRVAEAVRAQAVSQPAPRPALLVCILLLDETPNDPKRGCGAAWGCTTRAPLDVSWRSDLPNSPRTLSSSWRPVARALVVAGAVAAAVPALAATDGPGEAPAASATTTAPVVPAPSTTILASTEAAVATAAAEEAQDAQQDDTAAVLEFFRKVQVTGLVDAYYSYNFNEPATGEFTPLRNFDVSHNQFTVALAEIALGKGSTIDDPFGFQIDLNYGQVGQIFNFDPREGSALNIQQAYVSYTTRVGNGLTFDVGKFVTPIGTEPTESPLNNNYSRSFLYALGPYYHVGARIGYQFHDKFSVLGVLVNGWNAAGDNNSGKTVGVSLTYTPNDTFTFVQNVMSGPEQDDNSDDIRTMSDTNVAVSISDAFSTGLNYVYVRDEVFGEKVDWQGVALYARGQFGPVFALAPRFEIFDDNAGIVSGAVQQLKEFTLTAELKHSTGFLFRLEYRRDWSDIDFFSKNGEPKNNQSTVTAGFVYSFSSRN